MEVTIRTPAGASRSFAVDPHDTVAELTARSVARFVSDARLEPGRFGLGVLRGRHVVDLTPEAVLDAEGIRDGDILHLLNTEPQVDG